MRCHWYLLLPVVALSAVRLGMPVNLLEPARARETTENDSTSDPVTMFIRFANGELPVKRIDFMLDGQYFGRADFQAGPHSFSGSFQGTNFYIRNGLTLTGRSGSKTNNGITKIWGHSQSGAWIVDRGTKYLSLGAWSNSTLPDPVAREVQIYWGLSERAMSLGLSPALLRGSIAMVSSNQLSAESPRYGSRLIDYTRDESNRVKSISYVSSNATAKAGTTILYSYDNSSYGAWLPSQVTFIYREANTKLQKELEFVTTNTIRYCELGDSGPNEYEPDNFLANIPGVIAESVFSNGINYWIEGTNKAVVRAYDQTTGGNSIMKVRRTTIAIMVGTGSILLASVIWMQLRTTKKQHQRKGN
jgi:hypothetical protein